MSCKCLTTGVLAVCLSVMSIAPCVANTSDVKGPGVLTGIASYYANDRQDMLTATGERFDQAGFTAANWKLPLGAWVKVTNLLNGKSVNVRINDRNAVSQERIIDLSQAAARAVGMLRAGLAHVRVERISPPKRIQVAEIVPEPPRKPTLYN